MYVRGCPVDLRAMRLRASEITVFVAVLEGARCGILKKFLGGFACTRAQPESTACATISKQDYKSRLGEYNEFFADTAGAASLPEITCDGELQVALPAEYSEPGEDAEVSSVKAPEKSTSGEDSDGAFRRKAPPKAVKRGKRREQLPRPLLGKSLLVRTKSAEEQSESCGEGQPAGRSAPCKALCGSATGRSRSPEDSIPRRDSLGAGLISRKEMYESTCDIASRRGGSSSAKLARTGIGRQD